MDNAMNVGVEACGLLRDSLDVMGEIEYETGAPQISGELGELVRKYGMKMILAVLHDAAFSAAEVHEECTGVDGDATQLASLRLRIFANRLRGVIDTLT